MRQTKSNRRRRAVPAKINLLVIDWDYFFPCYTQPDHPHWQLYDWGHSESRSFFYDFVWYLRAEGFERYKLPLPGTSGEEKTFWERFSFHPEAVLYHADSNAFALEEPLRAGVPENYVIESLWLFDAHHDAGYGAGAFREVLENQRVACDDWMLGYYLFFNNAEPLIDFRMRYPAWKTWALEAEPEPKMPLNRQLDEGKTIKQPTFHRVFLCRSGAWTPPWLDSDYATFLEAAPISKKQALQEYPLLREWSGETLRELNENTRKLREDLERKRSDKL
jgi:hypothetical protein